MLQPLPSDIIQVVVAADNNYVMPLAVTVCSAAVNAAPERRLAFNVVHDGITAENRTRVNQSLARVRITNASIEWIQAPLSKFKDLRITHHWITPLTFVRLLVPDLLPTSVDKAIYLDCDVAVMEDIGGLWDLDLGDKSLLAAQDLIGWVSDPSAGLANYRELGFPPDKKYFNAGVLVLNLRKWRISNTPQALLDYLREYREVIRASDQEALNAVLGNDWGELDFRWNWQIKARIYRIGTHKMGWSPPDIRKSIIHFHSSEKPWLPACDYPEREAFFRYLDMTEWSGWRVPQHRELLGRLVRPVADARNALGRLRRRLAKVLGQERGSRGHLNRPDRWGAP